MENTESKRMLLSVIGVALLVVAIVGISYAAFLFTFDAEEEHVMTTGTISMSYTEGLTNVMSITNAIPMLDEVGKKQKDYFDFQISSKIAGATEIEYQIVARNLTNENSIPALNRLGEDQVKIYLEKSNGSQYEQVLKPVIFKQLETNVDEGENSKVLYTGKFSSNSTEEKTQSDQFVLRMWLDKNAVIDQTSRTFKIRIDVIAKTIK